MSENTQTPAEPVHKGLAGVVVDTTAISKVNPETNSLLYYGYPVQDLAARCTFEEVAYLLWHGELPTPEQLTQFTRAERTRRALPPEVKQLIDALPQDAHPMDVMRTAVSFIGARKADTPPPGTFATREQALAEAQELLAVAPAIIAYDQRRRRGQDLVPPRTDLDYASNFLWMTFGEEPAEEVARAFNTSLILYAEHSFNASTFTARVVTSTMSDLYSAVTAAIGALKGALHGGANEAVMHTFAEIQGQLPDGANAEQITEAAQGWLDDALARKRKIMGFGHRVYKNGDSRVPSMKAAMDDMVEHYDRPELAALYDALEDKMSREKNILPNLDYPAGPTYHMMGFDTQMFTPIFVAARISGWSAHIMEQAGNNSLIRPLSEYAGPAQRELPARYQRP